MKRFIFLIALLFASITFAQRIQEGEMEFNGGVGLYSDGWSLPLYAGLDYGIHPDISVGAVMSFSSQNYGYTGGDFKGRWLSIGANGNYHFNTIFDIPNQFDVYAGLTLAYNSFSYDYPSGFEGRYKGSGVGLAAQIGGRYFFNDTFGINLELGGGDVATGGKAGITIKF